jgi:hypothetical protein
MKSVLSRGSGKTRPCAAVEGACAHTNTSVAATRAVRAIVGTLPMLRIPRARD